MPTEPRVGTRKEELEIQSTACRHCGEPCPDDSFTLGEDHFCCPGCLTVYEILHGSGLEKFYDLDESAGQSLRDRSEARYAFLDDRKVADRLIDFSNGQVEKVTFYLPQIHCASCIWLLENLYRLEPGVEESRVNFPKKELYLTYKLERTSLRQIAELLYRIGYAPEINLGDLDKRSRPPVSRKLIYQLGVAGFAFGNIMLLSFPEYLNLSQASYDQFFQTFAYLNLLLALPVVLYSGRDYLLSAWYGIREGHLNIDVPISLGILALFGRSAWEILSQTGMGYMDSLAGLVFFLLVGKWFQQRTYYQLSFERDYRSYFPISAQRKTESGWTSASLDELKPGDILLVRHGELIPADSVLLKGAGKIDYSFVTGESEEIRLETGSQLYAGGRQMGGPLEISLTRAVSQSYLTQLWNNEAFTKQTKAQSVRLADRIGAWFTGTILTIATATFLYWMGRDLPTAFNAATAVLIIACPCAVALAIPFIFGNAIRLLARRGFYLKNTSVLEQLTRFDAAVLDKTGTLTSKSGGLLEFYGRPLDPEEVRLLLALTRPSTHPVSQRIGDWLHTLEHGKATDLPVLEDWQEEVGQGLSARQGETLIRLGSAAYIGRGAATARQARDTFLEIDGQVRGHFQLRHTFRPGLGRLVAFLRERKTQLAMLTGDHDGRRASLRETLGPEAELLFRQQPQDKLDFVKKLQAEGAEVLMLGDGLNDAGALKQSDCGIVLTEQTGAFTPASDGVLDAAAFGQLPTFLRFAHGSLRLVYAAYGLALIYNTVGLSFAVQGLLSPVIAAILMPLSSVTIVLFGLSTSSFLGWRMGLFQAGTDDQVAAEPKRKEERG